MNSDDKLTAICAICVTIILLGCLYFGNQQDEIKFKSDQFNSIDIFHSGYTMGANQAIKDPAINIDSMYSIDSAVFVNKYKLLQ